MNKQSFIKLDVDYTGENPQNSIEQEILRDIIKNTAYQLQHDIWFAKTAIFYTDPNDISGTRLTKDLHYFLENQDQIACDQTGEICVRNVRFLDDHTQLFVNYHVYGDLVKFEDFSEITDIIKNLTTDEIAEGNKNLYYQDTRVSSSPFAVQTEENFLKYTSEISGQTQKINEIDLIVKNHEEKSASNDSLGHIKLISGKIDPMLIPSVNASEVDTIGSYVHYASDHLPKNCVMLLGGTLNPEDFEDNLATLKQKVPENWVRSDGKVQLPNAYDRILQMDPGLDWGELQNDAMRNIRGDFGRFYGAQLIHTGPFYLNSDKNYPNLIAGGQGTACVINFDASRVVPTARKNRENTLNTVIALVTGTMKEVQFTQKYYLIDPQTKEYFGKSISLPVVNPEEEGIGFNEQIMVKDEPTYVIQDQLIKEFPKSPPSDPLGLFEDVRVRKNFRLSNYVNDFYRSFFLNHVRVELDATQEEFVIRKIHHRGSFIRFICTPSINDTSAYGTKKHIFYSSSQIEIHHPDFLPISIRTRVAYYTRISICGQHFVWSLFYTQSNTNQPLLLEFIEELRSTCPQDRLLDLDTWLQDFPKRLDNPYSVIDELGYLWGEKECRFYMKNDSKEFDLHEQNILYHQYADANTDDTLEIISAIQNSTFDLANYFSAQELSFFQDGKRIFMHADMLGFTYHTANGYYIKIPMPPTTDSGSVFGSKIVLHYRSQPGNTVFFGGPGLEEITSSAAHHTTPYLMFKEDQFLLWHADESHVPWGQKLFNSFINRCAAEHRATLQKILEQFPAEWNNSQATEDALGTSNQWGYEIDRRYFGKMRSIPKNTQALVWNYDLEKGQNCWQYIQDHRGETAYYCQQHYQLSTGDEPQMVRHEEGEETIISTLGKLPHYLRVIENSAVPEKVKKTKKN